MLRHAAAPIFACYTATDTFMQTAVDPATLDGVVYGTVIQEARTSNIARESALGAGVPDTTPAHTVTLACISANVAISHGAALIGTGQASAVVVGGTETMSDVPIRFSREMRKRMLAAQKGIRGIGDVIKFLRGFKLSYLIPEAPAIAEFSTGEVMGHSSDRLAAKWGVSRTEQDDFAFRSHTLAAAAIKAGNFHDEITPGPGGEVLGACVAADPSRRLCRSNACIPVNGHPIPSLAAGNVVDNGVRGDTPRSKYDTLKPAFIKVCERRLLHGAHDAHSQSSSSLIHTCTHGYFPAMQPHGTHTAANSSFLTDGASAALLMSEARAIADNVKPKAYLRDWIFVSQDPREELLLGPAYAIARLLARNGLTMRDISVVEMHEAFA